MTLSKLQKSILARAARAAWDAWPGRDDYTARLAGERNDPLLSDNQAFTHWRREQQHRACGKSSLRAATQDDYLLIRAHWEAWDPATSGAAMRTLLRHDSDGRRRALHVLERNTRERGLHWPGYPEAICRRQFKCALMDASEKQTWSLVYTIRNRRKAATRST